MSCALRFGGLCLLLLLGHGFAQAQPRATVSDAPLSERRVSYTMDVTLNPDRRTVAGTQRLTWRNPDRVPVGELQFHLYLNAFKDRNSTFMRESGGSHRGYEAKGDSTWGGIDVTKMQIVNTEDGYNTPSTDLMPQVRYLQPDDGNPDDRTVMAVTLPRAVNPGETITLDVDFTARMPKIFARTGWEESDSGEPFFMVAQWFPKLGVYEVPGQRYVPADTTHGRWNTHQFHSNSEFYADYGVYDVTITTPTAYRVGASGILVREEEEQGTRTVRYLAQDVHDFAWTSSPDFLEYTDQWRHVSIRLLLQPEHEGQAMRHFSAVKAALERYDAWVGEYPYTTLTLVDAIGGANGMEYPTLITCGTAYMLPEWVRPLELVTIHEFGHQYFYGLLASNEFEEAWLDEGINSYFESRIMDEVYGSGTAVIDLPGFGMGDRQLHRVNYAKNNPNRGALFQRSWEYPFGDYSKASYSKPATILNTLEQHLGWETMHRIWRTYYTQWRFRHPTTRDFIAVAESVSGQDLGWFFDQFVYGTAVVDYAVHVILNEEKSGADDSTTVYESEVRIKRLGDAVFPQTIRFVFDDGTTEEQSWDGRDAWKRFTFEGPRRVVEAWVDPENKVLLDVNRLNNRMAAAADRTLAAKMQLSFLALLQQLFYLITALA
jgi:hypothetical protein